ncbi:MAG: hypothetical protein JWO13_3097 [Acidobacteriales bacterium]|nr:hypothetical protein [Terriglobales bacterium]
MKTRFAAALILLAGICSLAQAQSPSTKKIYAQKLVDELFAKRNDLVSMGIHVTPPGQPDNVIIASNVPSKIGKKSSDDDMGVMRTGTPLIKLKGEDVYDIVLPIYVSSGKTIGIIGMNLRCKKGEGEASALKRARQIVAGLKRRIPSEAKLFEEVR